MAAVDRKLAALKDVLSPAELRALAGALSREELVADGMMDVKQAILFARVSRDTLYRWMDVERILPYSKMGPNAKRLIPKRALIKVLAAKMIVGEGFEAVNS